MRAGHMQVRAFFLCFLAHFFCIPLIFFLFFGFHIYGYLACINQWRAKVN